MFRADTPGQFPRRLLLFCLVVGLPLLLWACNAEESSLSLDDLAVDELMVAATLPGSGQLELGRSIGLRFVGAEVAADTIDAPVLENPPAEISPEIPGSWRWAGDGQLLFHPDEPYRSNTRYRVSLSAAYFTDTGLKLRGPRQFDFVAAPFECTHLNLDRRRLGTQPPTQVVSGQVVFNYPVDPAVFAAHLEGALSESGPVDWVIETTATSRQISFRSEPFASIRQGQQLQVSIRSDLAPVGSDGALGEVFERELHIPAIERLAIRKVEVGSHEEQPVVLVRFSEQVLPEDLRRHLKIEPEVPNLRYSGRWGVVELIGDWKFDTTYKLTVDKNLVSENGLELERNFSRSVTITPLQPMLRVTGPGNYLSLRGEGKVGIETINLHRFEVSIEKIFANNLVPFLQKVRLKNHQNYYYDWDLMDHGSPLSRTTMDVPRGQPNRLQVTAVDLKGMIKDDSRGVFRLQVNDPENNRLRDGRWLVATDLGLVAKQGGDDIEIAVASISKLQPVQGVKIQIMSHNNQPLASGYTDEEGMATFRNLDWDDPGSRPFVAIATLGKDLSFLAFDETQIRTADLDVGGVQLSEKGYRAYLYGDRDIYRPGETAHLVWMVRDANLQPPSGFPLNLRFIGPGGEDFVTARVDCDEAGTGEYSVDLPPWSMTGRYAVLLFLGENELLGETSISVEEFIPDRMKVSAELLVDEKRPQVVGPDEKVSLQARAMSLFGPPAADRQATASVWFRQTRVEIPGYEGFTFGENRGSELPPRRQLGQIKTDALGEAEWNLPLPQADGYQGWLKMTALVEVTELGGGRAVSSTAETNYCPTTTVIGLRNLSNEDSDYVQPGESVRFEAVMVDLAGHPVADAQARWKLQRRQWRTVLKKDGSGNYRYVSEYDEKLIKTETLALNDAPTSFEVLPETHGSYRLVVENADGTVRGAIAFYVYGHGYSPWAMSNPEKVNLKLDRETYNDGDVVTASVEAPFPGLMLLTVEREKVLVKRWFRMESNTATVQISLPMGSAPNVYLTATLLRPLADLDPRAPARAFGAQAVFIDRGPVTLPVEVATPEAMRPRQEMTVRVKLPATNQPLRLTVAAVDEGILQLTNFATPSALDFFLQRRRLSVTSFDIWSLLLPEYERVLRKSATGGDGHRMMADAGGLAKRLNPLSANRVKPVALWSGLLEGRPGWQDITFDVPEFNGSLRVMVLAAAGKRFGSAESQVQVADPIVLSPSLPRFLAPGDRFRVPVPVYNGLPGEADQLRDIGLKLNLTGPLAPADGGALQTALPVAIGREEVAWFELQANQEVGVAQVQVSAEAAGEKISVQTELSVRPPYALASRVSGGSVDNSQPFSLKISNDWFKGTNVTSVSVAANPVAQFGAALPYLLRYPYGCAEQITSRSFPLIYFGELAQRLAPGEFGANDGDYFVNSGLDYVATLFRPGRGFSMWPGRESHSMNAWATTYITHFLVEAEKQGYVLPANLLNDALGTVAGFARSSSNGWPRDWTRRHRLRTRAYAIYVLALADRPERGAMDQMVHGEWNDLTPVSRTHLAGAYALTGNLPRFEELLPAVDAPVEGGRSSGYSWFSMARDEAMRLDVLATVAPDHRQVPGLLQRLGNRAENGRWYNTQENAFALLALGKLAASGSLDPASGQVLVDGEVVGSFDAEGLSLQSRQWAGKTLEIKATSPGSAWFTVLDEGVPRQAEHPQYDGGMVVRREYLDIEGHPIDPMAIEQGQTIICRLLLASDKGNIQDVVVSDLLPAGLEIENPRLSRDGGYDWIEKQDYSKYGRLKIEHLEIRDDRLLLFTSAGTKVAAFHYTLRAVTAGEFILPQVRAEAMYDPEVMSTRGGGKVKIVSP